MPKLTLSLLVSHSLKIKKENGSLDWKLTQVEGTRKIFTVLFRIYNILFIILGTHNILKSQTTDEDFEPVNFTSY